MSLPQVFPSPGRRLAIIIVAMLGTVMQVLDTTIANVALPHMQSTLGATQDQINWVLTSYIVATAVVVPATGFLDQRLGRRSLFAIAIAGFTVSSMLCGLAWSLPIMIVARIMQGLFGAVIAPMAQAIMYDSNPPEERTRAMTIWSMGVMVAPVLGPVVGGYLTDTFNWRWVFFINVPIGIFCDHRRMVFAAFNQSPATGVRRLWLRAHRDVALRAATDARSGQRAGLV